MPGSSRTIGQPVSVCHQWSITGSCSISLRPVQRLGIAALAGEEQRPQAGDVVVGEQLRRAGPRC